MISEAGASVYSASEAAISELPTLDVTLRGAVSIARRLQDPLAELVKIAPEAIGVGMYQVLHTDSHTGCVGRGEEAVDAAALVHLRVYIRDTPQPPPQIQLVRDELLLRLHKK